MNKKIRISIGITAYNEALNIQRLLLSLVNQKLRAIFISEILVVSSGSSDGTNRIVNDMSKEYPKIKLIRQKKRLGKASAVNTILAKAKENIIVLCSADLILAKDAVEKLVLPFRDRLVGIVGSHPIPLNDPNTFFGFAGYLLWDLHHTISLTSPKMGECIAFRKVFKQIPVLSSVDEVNIESLIKGQGYKAVYAQRAIVYNKGVETLSDFIARRRHIYAGHLATKYEYGYSVSTISGIKIFFILLKKFQLNWRFIFWTPFIIGLEAYSRFLGFLDYKFKLKTHTVWQVTKSTKNLPRSKKYINLVK